MTDNKKGCDYVRYLHTLSLRNAFSDEKKSRKLPKTEKTHFRMMRVDIMRIVIGRGGKNEEEEDNQSKKIKFSPPTQKNQASSKALYGCRT